MNRGMLMAILVLGGGAGLALWRHHHRPTPLAQAAQAQGPSMVLYADLREADFSCVCGEVIRAAREAAHHGWGLRELEPGSADPLVARFALKTSPTVILLGSDGQPQARFEGEGDGLLRDLQARLQAYQVQAPAR